MPETIKFSILGVEQVTQKLNALPYDAKYKGGRFALRKTALHLAGIVRKNSERIDDPTTPNRSIPANVDVRFNRRMFDSTGDIGFRVGVRGGAGGNKPTEHFLSNPGGDTRYWRHLEFGTSKTRAQPFMRKALRDNISELTNMFVDEFSKAINRALKRASTNG